MGERQRMAATAAAEVGTLEQPKNSNRIKYNTWYYGREVEGSAYPWCAVFVSWCAAQAGIGTDTVPKMAYVPYITSFYQKQGRYFAKAGYQPQAGDLAIFGSNSHIGIVESADGQYVTTIEGNTSASGNNSNGDGVYRKKRRLTDRWIKGYCSPQYEGEEEVEIRALEIEADGKRVLVEAVNIGGNNFIKLRDVEKIAPVKVDWDAARRMPTVEVI